MSPYSRPQLWILVVLTAVSGLGLAIGQWRRGHPALAERIEHFDAGPTLSAPTGAPRAGAAAGATRESRSPRRPGLAHPREVQSRAARPPKRRPDEGRLDLNRASVEELARLPGVGSTLARRIAAARERAGRFASVEDLGSVAGVGTMRLSRLRELTTVSR